MSTQNVLFDAPGPKARQRHAILTGVGVLLAGAVLYVILGRLADAGQLDAAKWKPFVTDSSLWVDYLIPGLIGTLKAAILSVIFAGIFGLDMQDIGAQQTGVTKDEFKAKLVAAGKK